MTRIVVTGAAGLVGQNLIARLVRDPEMRIVGIDKHKANTRALARLHPAIEVIEADLAVAGPWVTAFQDADAVVQLHAHDVQRPGQRGVVAGSEQRIEDLAHGIPVNELVPDCVLDELLGVELFGHSQQRALALVPERIG